MNHFRIITSTVTVILFTITNIFAQQADSAGGIVLYDPIFWKDDLKLKSEQCSEIKAVNTEFYERILDTYEESPDNRTALNQAITQGSIQRSQQIWEIFSPKQRRKWTKLWTERYSSSRHNVPEGG